MKSFETGHAYHVNGGGTVTVTRRTARTVTLDGIGRKHIIAYGDAGLFGLGEVIWINGRLRAAAHEEVD